MKAILEAYVLEDALDLLGYENRVEQQHKHSLPDIHKIQADANMMLDGIIAIELYNDEIHYNGKIIYRGLYNRDDVYYIVRAYKEK